MKKKMKTKNENQRAIIQHLMKEDTFISVNDAGVNPQ